jgi:hypothetical protein
VAGVARFPAGIAFRALQALGRLLRPRAQRSLRFRKFAPQFPDAPRISGRHAVANRHTGILRAGVARTSAPSDPA